MALDAASKAEGSDSVDSFENFDPKKPNGAGVVKDERKSAAEIMGLKETEP
jgi:hypothetical protein